MARRLRQVVDLYSGGKIHRLRDDTPVWVQPMNPFEQETARSEAQIARTRLALAIRTEGTDERDKVRVWFDEDGRDAAVDRIVTAALDEATPKTYDQIRNDPEWSERMLILDRGLGNTATPVEDVEHALLERISDEFAQEFASRLRNEREFQINKIDSLDDEGLWEAYLEWYVNERATAVLMAEYRLHQIYFGVRYCEAVDDEGRWDHRQCNGHRELFFDNEDEVRAAPTELLDFLQSACEEVDMSSREAKNSDRQGSSSDSSLLPSAAVESTPSTPTETPVAPPGS